MSNILNVIKKTINFTYSKQIDYSLKFIIKNIILIIKSFKKQTN